MTNEFAGNREGFAFENGVARIGVAKIMQAKIVGDTGQSPARLPILGLWKSGRRDCLLFSRSPGLQNLLRFLCQHDVPWPGFGVD